MTAKEKDRKFPGLKHHEVITDIDGTRHIVTTLFIREIPKQGVPFLVDSTTTFKHKQVDRFLLRSELPNGNVIEY